MKTLLFSLTVSFVLIAACRKDNESPGSNTDYRDAYTGNYLCYDSSVTYHPVSTGDSVTTIEIDTIIVKTITVSVEKTSTNDSSISILGKEFSLARSGQVRRASYAGPLATHYNYNVLFTNDSLNYSSRIIPINDNTIMYREVRGNK